MMESRVAVSTLDTLKRGSRGKIVAVEGDDAISVRLLEMGLIEGVEVESLGVAPLGDPMAFFVRGYRLALRAAEARRISIESVG